MMLSMTAFARQQAEQEWGTLTWEVRSVNHRYLEASIRLPDAFRGIENAARELARKKLARGKVECMLRYQANEGNRSDLRLNSQLIYQLKKAHVEIEQIVGSSSQLRSMDVLRWPGVIEDAELDNDSREKAALALFEAALDELLSNRGREGEQIREMLKQRIASIGGIVADVRSKMPDILAKQKQSLLDKLGDLSAELDPTRLEMEVALLAQKADVDEELDRLDSHVSEVARVIETKGPKGRRLDFLMQELNREANTLSSKSIVVDTTMCAVELKVLIEQMREQIQNIE